MKKHLKRIKKLLIFIFVITIILSTSAFLYAKISTKPEIHAANSIVLYDNDNKVFFEGSGKKEWVSLNEINKNVINATISTEDKNFYKHKGFDFLRIIKAGYVNIKSGDTEQGASTITQQYAKNLFLDFEKTWKRKWEEALYTIKLEANYSKDEILEGYLNTINYGHGMYGIERASKFYFNKNSSDLSLAEATMLVGIPKSPSNYSPLVNPDIAKKRQKKILELMVKNGYITEDEKNKAYSEDLSYYGKEDSEESTTLMYFKDAVVKELENINSIPKDYNTNNGLKIYTTLDLNAQTNLEKNIQDSLINDENMQVASVMMNPDDGSIFALIGGRDYNKSEYNRALDSKRQVGSTMKPYLYYAALENGFTTSSCFTSEKTNFTFAEGNSYSPKNYNEKYGNKPISMAAAVSYSDNIYAVKTNLFLGSDQLINVAKRVGITAKLQDIPSLPLGTNEINIIEMTTGYAAFANLGYKVNPHFIKKIEDSNGKVLYEFKNNKNLVLNSSLSFILNNMLTSTYDPNFIDYNYPTAVSLANKLKHTYSLKSGTTDTDEWYIGYNSDVVTSVWLGYDDSKDISTKTAAYAQNIWYKSIEAYEEGKEDIWYKKPNNISAVFVDPISGKAVTENSEKKKLMYFIKGSEPTSEEKVFDSKLENASKQ